MLKGPKPAWEHLHSFCPVESSVELMDHIMLVDPSSWKGVLTHLIFHGLPLLFLRVYRHWRTRQALEASGKVKQSQ